jgi:hypothetical protein
MLRDELFTKEIRVTDKGSTYIIKTSGACAAILPNGSVKNIGRLAQNGNSIEYYCIRENRKGQLLWIGNAYGINEFMWREVRPDVIIIDVLDVGKRLSISYSDSKKVIKYYNFKNAGHETQVFIPVECMNEISKTNQVLKTGIIKINPPEIKKSPDKTVENFSLF